MNAELRKAAIVLASLDLQTAVNVCLHLPADEAEQIIAEMGRLGTIGPREQRHALAEFQEHLGRPAGMQPTEHAEHLMAVVLGADRVRTDPEQRRSALQSLRGLSSADAAGVRRLLAGESPQMVAVVLSQLTPEKAAQVLAQWPEEERPDLALRVARLGRLAPGALEAIGEALGRQALRVDEPTDGERGPDLVLHLLQDMDPSSGRRLLLALRERDAELAEVIEGRLFTFESIVRLSDADLQVLLRNLEQGVVARALKGAEPSIKERLLSNMSERAREMLQEEMELLGPVLVRDVEAAQKQIVATALDLEQAGEIVLSGDQDQYVE